MKEKKKRIKVSVKDKVEIVLIPEQSVQTSMDKVLEQIINVPKEKK